MSDRILVVEDEDRIRNIVRDYLTAHGLDCDLARDGEEALDRLESVLEGMEEQMGDSA